MPVAKEQHVIVDINIHSRTVELHGWGQTKTVDFRSQPVHSNGYDNLPSKDYRPQRTKLELGMLASYGDTCRSEIFHRSEIAGTRESEYADGNNLGSERSYTLDSTATSFIRETQDLFDQGFWVNELQEAAGKAGRGLQGSISIEPRRQAIIVATEQVEEDIEKIKSGEIT